MMIHKLRNTIENILIAIVTLIVMGFFTHFLVVKPMQRQIDKQTSVIIELAKIEKYKIENDFTKAKIKSKDGGHTRVDFENSLNALELDVVPQDTFVVKKQNFWQRIFDKRRNK